MMKVGDKAPDFTLPDHTGTNRSLADWAGQWVLLYFYPKDDTPGCTTEACSLRDHAYGTAGIIGVQRTSFLIDSAGKVAKIYENVKPAEHAEQVLADIKA